jgi:hypothetical protein
LINNVIKNKQSGLRDYFPIENIYIFSRTINIDDNYKWIRTQLAIKEVLSENIKKHMDEQFL